MPLVSHASHSGRLPLTVAGKGPVHVLVNHGWIADHTVFEPLIARLDQTRFTYAFLDCRGYGSRRVAEGPFSMAGVAEDVLLAADQLGWARFHIVGHSMGGMVAQRLLVDVPDRLESAVLLAPVPASGARLDPARRALLLRAIAEPEARRALIDANTGGVRPAVWIQQLLATSLRSTRPDVLEHYLHSWADTDFSHELKETTVPIQLILGALDPGATPERMQGTILRWFPHARMEIIRGAGHYPMLEQPEELNRMLTRLLSGTA